MKRIFLIFISFVFISKTQAQTTITDVDGNVYNTVAIGTQLWMVENLRTEKYNDGTPIFYPGTDNVAWENNINGAYSWYNNDSTTYSEYGILYNWFAVSPTTNGGKNICPAGWHVPSNSEWNKMEKFLNPTTDTNLWGGVGSGVGAALKESGIVHWYTGNTGTNTTGFTAYGGGERSATTGSYSYITSNGNFWTSSPYGSSAFYRKLQYSSSFIYKYDFFKNSGYSVRGVRDALVTALEENNNTPSIDIYPNPTNGSFVIAQANADKMGIEIYDVIGKLLFKIETVNIETAIDLTKQPKGIYFIKLTGENGNVLNKKIILQ